MSDADVKTKTSTKGGVKDNIKSSIKSGVRFLGGAILVAALIVNFFMLPGMNYEYDAGILTGLWNGILIIPNFIISIFVEDVGIYEIYNDGALYNVGFIIGTFLMFGIVTSLMRR